MNAAQYPPTSIYLFHLPEKIKKKIYRVTSLFFTVRKIQAVIIEQNQIKFYESPELNKNETFLSLI